MLFGFFHRFLFPSRFLVFHYFLIIIVNNVATEESRTHTHTDTHKQNNKIISDILFGYSLQSKCRFNAFKDLLLYIGFFNRKQL